MREVLLAGAIIIALAMGCGVKSDDVNDDNLVENNASDNSEPCDCPSGKITASYDDLFGNWRLVKRTYNDKVEDFSKIPACNDGRIAYRKDEKVPIEERRIINLWGEGKFDLFILYQGMAINPIFADGKCYPIIKNANIIRSYNKNQSCMKIRIADKICIVEFTPQKFVYTHDKITYEFARD